MTNQTEPLGTTAAGKGLPLPEPEAFDCVWPANASTDDPYATAESELRYADDMPEQWDDPPSSLVALFTADQMLEHREAYAAAKLAEVERDAMRYRTMVRCMKCLVLYTDKGSRLELNAEEHGEKHKPAIDSTLDAIDSAMKKSEPL